MTTEVKKYLQKCFKLLDFIETKNPKGVEYYQEAREKYFQDLAIYNTYVSMVDNSLKSIVELMDNANIWWSYKSTTTYNNLFLCNTLLFDKVYGIWSEPIYIDRDESPEQALLRIRRLKFSDDFLKLIERFKVYVLDPEPTLDEDATILYNNKKLEIEGYIADRQESYNNIKRESDSFESKHKKNSKKYKKLKTANKELKNTTFNKIFKHSLLAYIEERDKIDNEIVSCEANLDRLNAKLAELIKNRQNHFDDFKNIAREDYAKIKKIIELKKFITRNHNEIVKYKNAHPQIEAHKKNLVSIKDFYSDEYREYLDTKHEADRQLVNLMANAPLEVKEIINSRNPEGFTEKQRKHLTSLSWYCSRQASTISL